LKLPEGHPRRRRRTVTAGNDPTISVNALGIMDPPILRKLIPPGHDSPAPL